MKERRKLQPLDPTVERLLDLTKRLTLRRIRARMNTASIRSLTMQRQAEKDRADESEARWRLERELIGTLRELSRVRESSDKRTNTAAIVKAVVDWFGDECPF